MIGPFSEANPDITVELVDGGGYTETMDAALGAVGPDQPDIVLAGERAFQALVDGLDVQPVQELIDRDDFDIEVLVPAAVDRFSADGELVAMPFNISTAVMYTNADLLASVDGDLAAASIDPGVPEFTWERLFAICDALVGQVDVCIEFDNNAFVFEQFAANSGGQIFDQDDGRAGPPNEVVIDTDPTTRRVFEQLIDLVTSGRAVERAASFTDLGSASFVNGRAAFYANTISVFPRLTAALEESDVAFRLGSVSIPHFGDGPRLGPVASSGGLFSLDSGDDRRSIASWLLIRHLSGLDEQTALHESTGYIPIRSDVDESAELLTYWATTPPARFPHDQLVAAGPDLDSLQGRGGRAGPFHAVSGVIIRTLRLGQSGELSVDEALTMVVTDSNEILAEYNREQTSE